MRHHLSRQSPVVRSTLGFFTSTLAVLASCYGGERANAGSFLQKPGEGVAIVGGAFTDAVRAYDALGRLVPVAHWRKFAPLGSKLT